MSALVIQIIFLSLEIGNSILHGVGVCFLLCLYKRENKDSQNLFLLNLSCSELLWNIMAIIRSILATLHKVGYKQGAIMKMHWCFHIALGTGVCYIHILAMFYLTVDRLLHILLHLRYPVFWNMRKSMTLVLVTWVLNLFLGLILSLLTYFKFRYVYIETQINRILTVYVTSALYGVYLIFAAISYSKIFMTYARSEKRNVHKSQTTKMSLYRIFKNSRFYFPVIIIISYLVLTVVPSLTRATWLMIYPRNYNYTIMMFYHICVRLSHTFDGVAYIFLQKPVRKLLYKKVTFTWYSPDHNCRGGPIYGFCIFLDQFWIF